MLKMLMSVLLYSLVDTGTRHWGVHFKLGGRVRGTDGDLKLWFPSYETTIGITIKHVMLDVGVIH